MNKGTYIVFQVGDYLYIKKIQSFLLDKKLRDIHQEVKQLRWIQPQKKQLGNVKERKRLILTLKCKFNLQWKMVKICDNISWNIFLQIHLYA